MITCRERESARARKSKRARELEREQERMELAWRVDASRSSSSTPLCKSHAVNLFEQKKTSFGFELGTFRVVSSLFKHFFTKL